MSIKVKNDLRMVMPDVSDALVVYPDTSLDISTMIKKEGVIEENIRRPMDVEDVLYIDYNNDLLGDGVKEEDILVPTSGSVTNNGIIRTSKGLDRHRKDMNTLPGNSYQDTYIEYQGRYNQDDRRDDIEMVAILDHAELSYLENRCDDQDTMSMNSVLIKEYIKYMDIKNEGDRHYLLTLGKKHIKSGDLKGILKRSSMMLKGYSYFEITPLYKNTRDLYNIDSVVGEDLGVYPPRKKSHLMLDMQKDLSKKCKNGESIFVRVLGKLDRNAGRIVAYGPILGIRKYNQVCRYTSRKKKSTMSNLIGEELKVKVLKGPAGSSLFTVSHRALHPSELHSSVVRLIKDLRFYKKIAKKYTNANLDRFYQRLTTSETDSNSSILPSEVVDLYLHFEKDMIVFKRNRDSSIIGTVKLHKKPKDHSLKKGEIESYEDSRYKEMINFYKLDNPAELAKMHEEGVYAYEYRDDLNS